MLDLTSFLLYMQEIGGSDLYISAGAPISVRLHGEIRAVQERQTGETIVPSAQEARALIYELLTDLQKSRLESQLSIDFALALGESTRFRGNAFYHQRGLGAVFRHLPKDILSFDKLGLPKVVEDLIGLDRGLVLVTGPTGCGKTTTLACLLHGINRSRRHHVVTIEDPIEFIHHPICAMIHQRELGSHLPSFHKALREALREDPDVILVGEMRDLETISLAITAAETGHLVMSTLHTSSAAQTIERIVSVFPESEQQQIRAMVSNSLAAVISQILLPRIGGRRVAAFEVLLGTPAVRALVRDGKTAQIPTVIQTSRAFGMQSLEQSLMSLVKNGQITPEQAQHQIRLYGSWKPGKHHKPTFNRFKVAEDAHSTRLAENMVHSRRNN